jgi:hypothetical protein
MDNEALKMKIKELVRLVEELKEYSCSVTIHYIPEEAIPSSFIIQDFVAPETRTVTKNRVSSKNCIVHGQQ